MKNVTKRQIQAILAESVFTPTQKGPIKVIVDMADPRYCELKVVELLSEISMPLSPAEKTYNDKISQAISLLALARALRANTAENRKAKIQKKHTPVESPEPTDAASKPEEPYDSRHEGNKPYI